MAAYIEGLQIAAPSIKQRLAALRMLFDWLVIGQVLEELTDRVARLQHKNEVFAPVVLPDMFSWQVANFTVEVDMAPYIAEVFARVNDVDRAGALVTTSPDVMTGAAVFAGTRVPIEARERMRPAAG